MLSILIPKLILKGAINTFLIKPAVTSIVSILPSQVVCDASMAGFHVKMLTGDLYKYGIEKILEKFLDKQLEFRIKQLTGTKFEVVPFNKVAQEFLRFAQLSNPEKIILDMSRFEKELDKLVAKTMIEVADIEQQMDASNDALLHTIDVMDQEVEAILNKQIEQMNNLLIAHPKTLEIPEVDSSVRQKKRKRGLSL